MPSNDLDMHKYRNGQPDLTGQPIEIGDWNSTVSRFKNTVFT
jgi:hypothetical protein